MKLYQTLENQIKKEPNYVSDNGEVKKWVVLNKAQNLDEELISLLLDDSDLKEKFFVKVKDVLVFKQSLFIQFLEQKNYLNDSYTQFKNKVGLTIDDKYLKQRNEVALVWPFKDCVLEGGQSREEDKREEIFFNETLAQDEITELFDPKVLTNAKQFDEDGEKDFDQFNRNENGTITDNLIIKGNNLLALHSLKKEFAGKVKLIYIDPPYNTGNDGFKYNDRFNHSTWLTFVKNRLEIAKSLLREDGVILVQCDHHEMGYLNVLLDEVFGNVNKIQQIAVKVASASGFKAVNPGPIDVLENILFYSKNKKAVKFKKNYVVTGYHKNYNQYLDNTDSEVENWKLIPLKEKVIKENGYENEKELKSKLGKNYLLSLQQMIEDYAYKNANNIVSLRDLHKPTQQIKSLQDKSKNDRNQIFVYDKQDGDKTYIINGGALAFYSSKIKEIDGEKKVTELLTNFWNHISWAGIANEGGVKLKNGKKPEKLLKQILELNTEENDIVLDYHLGSGTTAAVAHKMNRQYIGIEQLNYGENDSVVRLQNVTQGDKTGISKSVNWQGGGSFIYLELKKYNQTFIEKIEAAEDSTILLQIWEEMKDKSFLNYNVDIQKQEKHLEDFKLLRLKDQKQHLCELLDKNQLYVNLSSLNDENFKCTEEEHKVTKAFYQLKN
ncbi:adenine-specific DNA-methyltransferase [Chryseobacterium arachidis]|uniref:site-specific DNA-methyltransferase (adenine-specific) n=1 Tax=Chryseobacterium arachidis TaxID=1416778 RepID=A0A1M4U755_9FLAO|nr:site-specific DNA-methyltransferase [Chryseobacterium arachidis]SHE52483.1 adenine-specific DNA-methyltransferase [Chryseobacterium arachidis]